MVEIKLEAAFGLLRIGGAGGVACEPFYGVYRRNWTGTGGISLGMVHSLGLPQAEPFVG